MYRRSRGLCVGVCPLVRQPTFRYEESRVVEVRESVAVVAISFNFLVALLADDESSEGAIHRVIGDLAWREDRSSYQETDVGTGNQEQAYGVYLCMKFGATQWLNLAFSSCVSPFVCVCPEHTGSHPCFLMFRDFLNCLPRLYRKFLLHDSVSVSDYFYVHSYEKIFFIICYISCPEHMFPLCSSSIYSALIKSFFRINIRGATYRK